MARVAPRERRGRQCFHVVESLELRVLLSTAHGLLAVPAVAPAGTTMQANASSGLVVSKTKLLASSAKATAGSSITLTATVASSPASATGRTGSITFRDGATVLGTVPLGASSSTVFSLTPTVGSHAFTATYSGDATFASSASPARKVTITIAKVKATLAIPTPLSLGTAATFTATLTSASPGSGVPTGTITFKDGSTVLGTAQVGTDGTAVLSVTPQTAGSHKYSISYSGDALHAPVTVSHAAIKLTGVVVPKGDLTYIGQFKTDWIARTDPTADQITGTGLSFNLTVKLHQLAPVANGLAVYEITSVSCSEAYFGALLPVTPNNLSLAILPSPALNSSPAGAGFAIFFPNGTSLSTENGAGAMHQSSDGRIVSSSVGNANGWFQGPDPGGNPVALEREMIPVNFVGEDAGFQNLTWAMTLSAT